MPLQVDLWAPFGDSDYFPTDTPQRVAPQIRQRRQRGLKGAARALPLYGICSALAGRQACLAQLPHLNCALG